MIKIYTRLKEWGLVWLHLKPIEPSRTATLRICTCVQPQSGLFTKAWSSQGNVINDHGVIDNDDQCEM